MNQLISLINSLNNSALPIYVLFGSVFLLCVTTVLLLQMTRKLSKEHQQVRIIKEDLKAFSVAAIGVGKRVLQLEKKQRILANNPAAPEQVVTYVEPANQTYDEAAHMARQGKNVESIMHRCGLSHSEAELIFLMNRLDKTG